MKVLFEKYHSAGNDFILIDNRKASIHFTKDQIAHLCDRHRGIGADGLILIQQRPRYDFDMIYFNADGGIGSMCGNGGRCAVIFARKLGIISNSATFLAYDGSHQASIHGDGTVKLSMMPVHGFKKENSDYVLSTGSPHLVKFVPEVGDVNVFAEGKAIRYNEYYGKEGINVNFVSTNGEEIRMRTYERGVENETLSCGTGTVAVAMAVALEKNKMNQQDYSIAAPGGLLKVYFNRESEEVFADVWLEGPVTFVFEGSIEI